MNSFDLFNWLEKLIYSFNDIGDFLTTPIFGDWSPMTLTLVGGLTAFLVVAVVKWVAS